MSIFRPLSVPVLRLSHYRYGYEIDATTVRRRHKSIAQRVQDHPNRMSFDPPATTILRKYELTSVRPSKKEVPGPYGLMKRSTFDFIRSSGLSLAMWSTSPKWLTKRVWGGDTTPVFVSVSDTRVANMLCLEPELLPSSFLSSETMEAKTSVTRGKRNLFKEKEPHGGSLTDEAKLGNSSQTDQPMSASRSVGSPPLVTRPTSPPPRCSSAPGDGRDDGAQRNSWWQVDLFRHGSFMVQMWFQTVG